MSLVPFSPRLSRAPSPCSPAPVAHTQVRYTITGLYGLGTDPSGHVHSYAGAINNRGQIAGGSNLYSTTHQYAANHAFLSERGAISDLGSLAATTYSDYVQTVVTGINDAGEIVGYAYTYDANHEDYRGFRLLPGGALMQMTGFGSSLTGTVDIEPTAINNSGIIVGRASFYDESHNFQGQLPFRYDTKTGAILRLPTVGADVFGNGGGSATGINDYEQIVGGVDLYDLNHNRVGASAFLYAGKSLVLLGNLGVNGEGRGYSFATAINNEGEIVGYSTPWDTSDTPYGPRAVLFRNGTPVSLGSLGTNKQGYGHSQATGINDKGQVVGLSDVYDNNGVFQEYSVFVYHSGVMYNLNSLIPPGFGWHLEYVTGINNRGQIVGWGYHNGAEEAFLLTPITAGDFNGDGSPDLVLQNATTGAVSLSLLNGTTPLSTQSLSSGVPAEWRVGAVCDVSGDGYPDLIWQNTRTGDVLAWILGNGLFPRPLYLAYGIPHNYKLVGSGDINGDGYPDLLWQDTNTGSVTVWYLTGTSVYAASTFAGPGAGWNLTGVADMDGDSKPDLLWRNTTTGDLYVWLMDGETVKSSGSKRVASGVPLVWQFVASGDYNGDGETDLLWQNADTGLVTAWFMNGTTLADTGLVTAGFGAGWNVVGPR